MKKLWSRRYSIIIIKKCLHLFNATERGTHHNIRFSGPCRIQTGQIDLNCFRLRQTCFSSCILSLVSHKQVYKMITSYKSIASSFSGLVTSRSMHSNFISLMQCMTNIIYLCCFFHTWFRRLGSLHILLTHPNQSEWIDITMYNTVQQALEKIQK